VISKDGAAYLRDSAAKFDVIVTDSSDPIGPAATLFETSFTGLVASKLSEGGVAVAQGECMWIHSDIIVKYIEGAKQHFEDVSYRWMSIPTYPCGTIGTVLMKNHTLTSAEIVESAKRICCSMTGDVQYYNPDIHQASTALPNFVSKSLNSTD